MAAAWGGYLGYWRYHLKRFQATRAGVYMRAAQPTEFGLNHLVKRHGVKTVVSLQLWDWRLKSGLADWGDPDGEKESDYVNGLGANYVQWPMGDEKYWPWLTPWQFERFFELLDDPRNWPVAVHCMGGRHRTGTLSALFRLEYDRWPIEKALAEMYSFDFGQPIPLQEANLRTYWPRPRPNEAQWGQLRHAFRAYLRSTPSPEYQDLIHELRGRLDKQTPSLALAIYWSEESSFRVSLAARVIDRVDPATAQSMVAEATRTLERAEAGPDEWSSAAAIVADYGDEASQRRLLAILAPTPGDESRRIRRDALAAGVMNRYTPNRIAFLRPFLADESPRLAPGSGGLRICDTAVARLSVMIDRNLLSGAPGLGIEEWNHGRKSALAWLDEHPEATRLGPLREPTGKTVVRAGDQPGREDTSRMRR